jgi:hypothetical protein
MTRPIAAKSNCVWTSAWQHLMCERRNDAQAQRSGQLPGTTKIFPLEEAPKAHEWIGSMGRGMSELRGIR